MNKHKALRITERICQNNDNFFVTVHPRNACKMEFADDLWFPFIGQP